MSTGLTGRLMRSRRCSVLRDRQAGVPRRSPRRTLKTALGRASLVRGAFFACPTDIGDAHKGKEAELEAELREA